MPSRKRSLEAADHGSEDSHASLLERIRNMWQFANLCQWMYIFGKVAKIDESLDIERMETECLKPESPVFNDIALALLKLSSSHRGLTHEIFDDQARKQFLKMAPNRNPFGDHDSPTNFVDFDVFTKISVLQQMTQWAMTEYDRLRFKMEEQKDTELATWRIEPYGWDSEDRTYFVLDDNRVYRLTEAPEPVPQWKPKKKKKIPWSGSRRHSKRRRTTESVADDSVATVEDEEAPEPVDDGLGGMKWECVAITLDDVRQLLDGLRRTRDDNEKVLRRQLEDHLLPILEQQEASRLRREQQRERDLLNLAKMANAKRSSRIAGKAEMREHEEKERLEEQQRREAEAAERREQQKRIKLERERELRLGGREKRLKEREARRVAHEEELATLSEDSRAMSAGAGNGRISERRLQAEIERNRQALLELEEEDDDWEFDCICGAHGRIDDGTHSVACEKCNVWQHSACLNISEEQAESPSFQFVCSTCKRKEKEAREAAARPKTVIKLKVDHSPPQPTAKSEHMISAGVSSGIPTAASTTQLSGPRMGSFPSQQPHEQNAAQRSLGAQPNLTPSAFVPRPQNGPSPGLPVPHDTSKPVNGVNLKQAPPTARFLPPVAPRAGPGSIEVLIPSKPIESPIKPPVTTPGGSKQITSPGRAIDSSLSTPKITHDIYRANHVQNGALPSVAGFSPTKQSPQGPSPETKDRLGGSAPGLPPPPVLSPSPREAILTPPVKSSEPVRQNGDLNGK